MDPADLNPLNREGTALRTRKDLTVLKNVTRKGWTRRDLNPWPSRCKRDDLPLIYEPAVLVAVFYFSADSI